MASEYLQKLYQEGHLKHGCSERVDQAIVALRELGLPASYDRFAKRWRDFVGAVISDFPNIQPFNLTFITTMLTAARFHKEELLICHLMVELQPESDEAHCFLGHAYKRIERYDLALPCYQQAYQLAISRAEAKQMDAGAPLRLDACDYLGGAAGCQLHLHLHSAALMSITKAFQIIRKAGDAASFKVEDMTDLLAKVMAQADWGGEEFEIEL